MGNLHDVSHLFWLLLLEMLRHRLFVLSTFRWFTCRKEILFASRTTRWNLFTFRNQFSSKISLMFVIASRWQFNGSTLLTRLSARHSRSSISFYWLDDCCFRLLFFFFRLPPSHERRQSSCITVSSLPFVIVEVVRTSSGEKSDPKNLLLSSSSSLSNTKQFWEMDFLLSCRSLSLRQ